MKEINPHTIEKYVRYSNIPYPEIIKRALKSGWKVLHDWSGHSETAEEEVREVTITNSHNDYYSTSYCLSDPTGALYSIYGFDKHKTYTT